MKKSNEGAVVADLFNEATLPSRKHNISAKEERTKRRKTCNFIQVVGGKLKLPHIVIATAMLFFHHFYAKHSFKDYDPFEVALASILLAAKTEEAPKKLTTVVQACYHVKTKQTLDLDGEEFKKLKKSALLLERMILHTIAFELSITHPYKHLNDKIHEISSGKHCDALEYKDQTKTSQDLRKNANFFATESLFTSLCLQHHPTNIALACVFMSAVSFQIRPAVGGDNGGSKAWLELLDNMDLEVLRSIVIQIMESITEKRGSELNFFGHIRSELNKMNDDGGRKRRRTN